MYNTATKEKKRTCKRIQHIHKNCVPTRTCGKACKSKARAKAAHDVRGSYFFPSSPYLFATIKKTDFHFNLSEMFPAVELSISPVHSSVKNGLQIIQVFTIFLKTTRHHSMIVLVLLFRKTRPLQDASSAEMHPRTSRAGKQEYTTNIFTRGWYKKVVV